MPDITMCVNQNCPLSKTCYRHEDSGTISDIRQSWTDFKWDINLKHEGEFVCENYLDVSDKQRNYD
jgi:hypothetical protein